MRILAIMPARNELANLPAVLEELEELRPDLDVLVVDDGSSDHSSRWLDGAGVPYLRLAVPLGVGGAVRAGLRYARNHGYRRAIRLDADGQHPPDEIDKVLAPIHENRCAAACGSRFLDGETRDVPLSRRIAQKGLTWSLSRLTGQRVSDPTSGFWAFGPEALDLLARHHPTGYPEPELHLLLHRNRLGVEEVSVRMRPRTRGRSSLTPAKATLAMARAALAMIVVPLRTVVAGRSHV